MATRGNSQLVLDRPAAGGRAGWLRRLAPPAWVCLAAASAAAGPDAPTRFETKYYVIHSDLDIDDVREAMVRIDRVAEEYDRRTRAFAGVIRRKLSFYLFSRVEDYTAAGGPEGSAGVFTGDKLMALADRRFAEHVWSVVQHEGFHQFAHAVIGGDLPMWVNEGLAEYFSEGIFTGDGFLSGVIPPGRLGRVQAQIAHGRYKAFPEIMLLTQRDWNTELASANYDQVWSMVHFLGHGENGRYEQVFNGFLRAISRGRSWEHAWLQNFGPGTDEFENAWRQYWMELGENPTAVLYAHATTLTLTGFLARAISRKQTFDSAEQFFAAGAAGTLGAHPNDWLPPSLLSRALGEAENAGTWSLDRPNRKQPRLVCVLQDGTRLTGRYTLGQQRVTAVEVTINSN